MENGSIIVDQIHIKVT